MTEPGRTPILHMRGVSNHFGAVQVLSDVDFGLPIGSGWSCQPLAELIGHIALVAAAVFAIAIMSINRSSKGFNPVQGVPSAVLIFVGFIVVFDFITRFGRYMFAMGGNSEAARRAGINVDRI